MRRGTYLQRDPDRQLNCPASIPSVLEATATGGCLQPHCDRTRTVAQGRVLRLNSVIGSGRACKGRGAAVMQLACAPFALRPLTRTSSALPRVTPAAASMEAPAVS